jgi:CRISPR/Cas system CMR subunit Cmr6 (Cas7 group RAMP superfamily)
MKTFIQIASHQRINCTVRTKTYIRFNVIYLINRALLLKRTHKQLTMQHIAVSQAQLDKIEEIKQQGYTWNKALSTSYAAVVMNKGNDIWVFDLDGEIHHNPHIVRIPVKY